MYLYSRQNFHIRKLLISIKKCIYVKKNLWLLLESVITIKLIIYSKNKVSKPGQSINYLLAWRKWKPVILRRENAIKEKI